LRGFPCRVSKIDAVLPFFFSSGLLFDEEKFWSFFSLKKVGELSRAILSFFPFLPFSQNLEESTFPPLA